MPTGAIPSSRMALPITEKPQRPAVTSPGAHPAFYIATWIFFSNLTILFNKWLIDSAGFREPTPPSPMLFLLCSETRLVQMLTSSRSVS